MLDHVVTLVAATVILCIGADIIATYVPLQWTMMPMTIMLTTVTWIVMPTVRTLHKRMNKST